MVSGQLVVFRALCSDNTDSKDVFGVVFKEHDTVARCYCIRVLAAQSGYYRRHVLDRKDAPSLTLVRLPRTPQEADTYQQGRFVFENATRWRSVQDEQNNMIWDLVPWIQKVHHTKLANEIDFFRSWLSKSAQVKANAAIPLRKC